MWHKSQRPVTNSIASACVVFPQVEENFLIIFWGRDNPCCRCRRLGIWFEKNIWFSTVLSQRPLRHKLLLDSKSLFETSTMLHQKGNYRLQKTVPRLRYSFEFKELYTVRWIQRITIYINVLTKRNIALFRKFNDVLVLGLWTVETSYSCSLDVETWKWSVKIY